MYIIYESYNDDFVNKNNLTLNTKIIAIYNKEKQAIEEYNNYIQKLITQNDENFDWFCKELDLELFGNEDIILANKIFNESIDDLADNYIIILEKKGCE